VIDQLPSFIWTDESAAVESRRPRSFPSTQRGHTPGELGLWIFILGDLSIFGAFFVVFLVENRGDRVLFANSAQDLYRPIGAINTLVLLLSSYLVVIAIDAHRRGDFRRGDRAVLLAGLCAIVFASLKAYEYWLAVSGGHTPSSNIFFTFYFVLTGIHLLHVLIGIALLMVWRRRLSNDRPWAESRVFAESAAVYWHMVDLLWVLIFTLLYLVCVA
jgi:nitric oxide reductase NorE protein